MFSWATSRLESLAQTVAPPSTDPHTKLFYCCQRGDEDGAVEVVQQNNMADLVHTVVQAAKGQTVLHLACLYSMPKLLHLCLQQQHHQHQQYPQSSSPQYSQQHSTVLHVTDADGNTPLHCAAMSNQQNALDLVKTLLLSPSAAAADPHQQQQPAQPDAHAPTDDANHQAAVVAAVLARNRAGQTAYDVAVLNAVRQFLLPRQLQAETQVATDNGNGGAGGMGLPPGTDMGGLYSAAKLAPLPPPPVGMPPPTGLPTAAPAVGHGMPASPYPPIPGMPQQQHHHPSSMYPPTPGFPQQQQQASNSTHSSVYTTPSPPPPQQFGTPHGGQESSPAATSPSEQPPPPQQQQPPTSGPPSSGGLATCRPPTSTGSQHSYALTGRSSAAILRSKSGIQPDGFHSSSSDKNLAEKYGNINANQAAVPPPPYSGNYTGADAGASLSSSALSTANHSSSGATPPSALPPPLPAVNGGPNPFAGGASALGSRATTGRRYVAYDPFAGGSSRTPLPRPPGGPTSAPASTSSSSNNHAAFLQPQLDGYGGAAPAAAPYESYPLQMQQQQTVGEMASAPYYGQQQQQQGGIAPTVPLGTFQQLPPAPHIGSGGAAFMAPRLGAGPMFASPVPAFGKTPSNTPLMSPSMNGTAPTPSFLPPPPYQSGAASPRAFGSAPSQPPEFAGSAASVFGTVSTPTAVAGPTPVAAGTPGAARGFHRSSSTPAEASALFSRPVGTPELDPSSPAPRQQPATPRSATDLFGATAPTVAATGDAAAAVAADPLANASDPAAAAGAASTPLAPCNDEDDDLDDVPLTPGHEDKPAVTSTARTAAAPGSTSGSIGMPPPPFSRK